MNTTLFEIQASKSLGFKSFWYSNGRYSDSHSTFNLAKKVCYKPIWKVRNGRCVRYIAVTSKKLFKIVRFVNSRRPEKDKKNASAIYERKADLLVWFIKSLFTFSLSVSLSVASVSPFARSFGADKTLEGGV